jgi:transposase-like protein
MKQNLSVNLLVRLQKLDFTLDEVIIEFEQVFKMRGMPGILEVIFEYIDGLLVNNIATAVIPKMKHECCSNDTWHSHGWTTKNVKTSMGTLKLRLKRMKCLCKTTHTPFHLFFGLSKQKNFSNELQKKCCELVCNQSYRRSARELNSIGNLDIKKNELYRIVNSCDLDFQNTKNLKNIDSLMADATKYKPHFEEQKSDLKILVGLTTDNKPVPIGAWIFKGWKAIGNELKKNNSPANKLLMFKPIANVLITDGEIAIIKGLKHLAHHLQRCQWHFVRDFKNAYVYQGKGDKSECKKIQNEIYENINNCISALNKDEKSIIDSIVKAELHLEDLEKKLDQGKLNQAATYVRNARQELFTHLKIILATGEEVYRTTSVIERIMRELARRFKRIAHNWSEAGAERLARMLLRYTLDKKGWDKVWEQKIIITGNFKLETTGIYPT